MDSKPGKEASGSFWKKDVELLSKIVAQGWAFKGASLDAGAHVNDQCHELIGGGLVRGQLCGGVFLPQEISRDSSLR